MLKYSINFSVKNNKTDSLTPVRLRVSFNGIRPELYPGVTAKPSEWNKTTQRIDIANKKDQRNKDLNKAEECVEEIFKEFDAIEKRFPTSEELKEKFADKNGKRNSVDTQVEKKEPPFYEVINLYIAEKSISKQWEVKTLKKYEKLRNHIKTFNQNLLINKVEEKTLRDLIKYFSTAPINPRSGKVMKPHRNSTIKRTINDYKRILSWAQQRNIYSGDAHVDFEQRFKGTTDKLSDLIYLELDELMKLYHWNYSNNPRLDKVRDVFCFLCFTSLRFSDVEKLKKSHIRDNKIIFTTQKTTDPLVIELNDYAKSILNKYKDFKHPKGLVLPVISMDKTNEYLKEIGEELEFNTPVREHYFIGTESKEIIHLKWQVLSTHAGRRTFVVNALRLKIPTVVIREWTGHKTEEAMRPYKKIVDELKSSEMSKFNFTPESTPENDKSFKYNKKSE
ncbi:hypothetical protein BAS10_04690 [Elizabethkingia meningoseptica]|uniref:site-specific integrase n=1 Tax=Elizabethkingia meningoseptica TaxID=238 RepID=UPI00099922DA|nr:site-specific integrase [Elizabethkingia meningoseptica]OPB98968.1 hypothetical protein BAS10_04690 [Elizabethkingia meningoseptica]